jgi:hypothetical protein
MKKLFSLLCATVVLIPAAYGGPQLFSSKDTTVQPCPIWYADREWNVSLWGTYAFTANDYPTLGNSNPFLVVPKHDTYIEADHAWGGGIDAKYFFARYFGLGVEGYGLDVNQSFPHVLIPFFGPNNGSIAGTAHDRRTVGSILGTFTLRYPIGCSRFAPYVFAGGGVIFGGAQTSTFSFTAIPDGEVTLRSGSTTKAVGQFGGGFEVRITPHIGLINDFTWNVIDGRDNNFGMARTGINIAF